MTSYIRTFSPPFKTLSSSLFGGQCADMLCICFYGRGVRRTTPKQSRGQFGVGISASVGVGKSGVGKLALVGVWV